MQFDLSRAFPYPVLRSKVDDYIDGDIQATIEFSQSLDGHQLSATIQFALSVPEIKALIAEGRASYAVVFACRDTYYREPVFSTENKFEHSFSTGALRGEVLIYPYVVARVDINNFECGWINPEFGKGPFQFLKGSALALEEPQSVYVDRDSFKPISSSFVLVKDDTVPYGEWRVKPDQNKVRIAVNPELKARLDVARNNNKNKAILLNSIYLGAVTQCVSLIKNSEEFDEFRWAKIFRQRCEELSIELKKNHESWIAQQLMHSPFKLIDTYFLDDKGDA
ncbi:hypothetical protein JS562_26385 [Agrobacterium sp. S2]|nr:hypothetical protein [Agrobacterium sp. S2]